jgi:MFS family permease
MAGGEPSASAAGERDYPGRLTLFMFMVCLVVATGCLIFGYDIGISGGVTSMDPFLSKFYPSVYRKQQEADEWSMFIGGVTFLAGYMLNDATQNVPMLILSRVLLGVSIGFANQSVLVYLSEMAPAMMRGMLNNGFQLMITLGILAANLINYGSDKIFGSWGWRLSLALATVPVAIITAGSLFLLDTPNSLLERGKPDDARRMLQRVYNTDDVDAEYHDPTAASEASNVHGATSCGGSTGRSC